MPGLSTQFVYPRATTRRGTAFADSAMLELGRYGVHPSVAKSFVLKTLAPQHWVRTLSIANDLRELSQEGLKNVAELLRAIKTDNWQNFPPQLSPVAVEL